MVEEAQKTSQLEGQAEEMLGESGPRLVGTPQRKKAHDWAVETYKDWGIKAENEKWGDGASGNAGSLILITWNGVFNPSRGCSWLTPGFT